MSDLKSKTPDETLDVQGRPCPYPIIMIKNKMESLLDGQILKIVSDSSSTVEDAIPRYCEKHGCRFELIKVEEDHWEVYIRKGRGSL